MTGPRACLRCQCRSRPSIARPLFPRLLFPQQTATTIPICADAWHTSRKLRRGRRAAHRKLIAERRTSGFLKCTYVISRNPPLGGRHFTLIPATLNALMRSSSDSNSSTGDRCGRLTSFGPSGGSSRWLRYAHVSEVRPLLYCVSSRETSSGHDRWMGGLVDWWMNGWVACLSVSVLAGQGQGLGSSHHHQDVLKH